MTKDFIGLDAETNGIDGLPYSIAMVRYRNGIPRESLCVSCEIQGDIDAWLQENPHLQKIEDSEFLEYEEMLKRVAEFYNYHASSDADGVVQMNDWGGVNYQSTPILFHCGMVVEGNLFKILKEKGLVGRFDAPIAPIDVADYLRVVGEDPNSVDAYIKKYSLSKPQGFTHNPLYDVETAATAYLHIIDRIKFD